MMVLMKDEKHTLLLYTRWDGWKYSIVDLDFIHKIRITLQGALYPWRNSKFHFIKSPPDLRLASCHVSRESKSHCWNEFRPLFKAFLYY